MQSDGSFGIRWNDCSNDFHLKMIHQWCATLCCLIDIQNIFLFCLFCPVFCFLFCSIIGFCYLTYFLFCFVCFCHVLCHSLYSVRTFILDCAFLFSFIFHVLFCFMFYFCPVLFSVLTKSPVLYYFGLWLFSIFLIIVSVNFISVFFVLLVFHTFFVSCLCFCF